MTSNRGRKSGRRLLSAALLSFALVASLLVACDSDDDGDATETATPGDSTPSTTATAAPTTGGGGGGATPPPTSGSDGAYQSALDLMLQQEVGTQAGDEELAAAHFDIHPDGEGLPEGSGLAAAGAEVYAAQCASCHGQNGEGGANGAAPQLIIENAGPWAPGDPKVIGNYWPYATTVYDYIRRAMPFTSPGSLSDEEVYAVVAYLLAQNGVIAEDQEMNAETLPQVEMPNRDNFFSCWPDECRPDVDGADAPGGGGGEGSATPTGTPPDEYEPTPGSGN